MESNAGQRELLAVLRHAETCTLAQPHGRLYATGESTDERVRDDFRYVSGRSEAVVYI